MNPAQLLAHFDRISEAPDAIPRLRRFILDLAVRGKLVEQDPKDEPAFRLPERAEASSEGEERPFSVPASWAWLPVGAIGTSRLGKMLDRGKNKGTPRRYLRNVNVRWFDFDLSDVMEMRFEDSELEEFSLRSGDVLICEGGEPGRAAVWDERETDIYFQKAIHRVRFAEGVSPHYFADVLRQSAESGRLATHFTGVAIKHLTGRGLSAFLVPLPPLGEQHRIVAKVDELMALCDRLEAAQAERESRRDRLAAASLNRLNQSADAAGAPAFRDHARFHLRHLPRLSTRPDQIPALRQTILNLAVRGQLVPQDPTDESASVLLERVQALKARLAGEGKIARQKPPRPATADELVFELKPGWQPAKISQVLVELQTGPFGSSLHQSDYEKGGTPVINPASIKNERLIPIDSMAVGAATLERLATFKLRTGDIVMGRRGEMGRCAVVTRQEDGWLCGTGSLILRLPECVFPRFLVTLIGSPLVREYLGGSAVGATMQNLNQSILLTLVIGLPPLAEQHRIVAKVDELMALCDRLEAQLTGAQTESRLLLEAVLHHALAPVA